MTEMARNSSMSSFDAKAVAVPGRTCGPTRRSSKGGWTDEEDDRLTRAVSQFNGRNWKKIAVTIPYRTDLQCLHRWQKVLNPELVKGTWTKKEDDRLNELVAEYGTKKWSRIAQFMPGRIGKQCRERWHNQLNPAIKKDAWTWQEEVALIRLHQVHGNKWAAIAKYLPGRLGTLQVDQKINTAASVRRKNPAEKPSSTSKVHLAHHVGRFGRQDLSVQPVPVGSSQCSRAEDWDISADDSKRSKIEVKDIPADDFKRLKTEVKDIPANDPKWITISDFLGRSSCSEDRSHANGANSLLLDDADRCSTELLHQVANSWNTKLSDFTDASDDPCGASAELGSSSSTGNHFFSQIHFNRSVSNVLEIYQKPHSTVSRKFHNANISSLSTEFGSHDKHSDHSKISRATICDNTENSGSLYYASGYSSLELANN